MLKKKEIEHFTREKMQELKFDPPKRELRIMNRKLNHMLSITYVILLAHVEKMRCTKNL